MIPRHLRNPTTRFTGRGEWYHSSRPALPSAIVDAVLLGFNRGACTVADFGAGTGLSSLAFAEAISGESKVIAIEPNGDMRSSAPEHPRIQWLAATAEETGLANASVDVVTSTTAFHWFSPEKAPREMARVLRPGGRLAVMVTDRDADDALANEFHRLMGEHEPGITSANIRKEYGHAFIPDLYSPPRLVVSMNVQEYGLERMLARARSSSYLSGDDAAQEKALDAVAEFWRKNVNPRGVVAIHYHTVALLAERTGDS